jgi:hypothetical protein
MQSACQFGCFQCSSFDECKGKLGQYPQGASRKDGSGNGTRHGGTDQEACGNDLTSSLQSGKEEEGELVLRARGLDSSLKASPWQFFQLSGNQLPDTPGQDLG